MHRPAVLLPLEDFCSPGLWLSPPGSLLLPAHPSSAFILWASPLPPGLFMDDSEILQVLGHTPCKCSDPCILTHTIMPSASFVLSAHSVFLFSELTETHLADWMLSLGSTPTVTMASFKLQGSDSPFPTSLLFDAGV